MSISYEKHGAETTEWLLEYLSAGGPDQIDGDDYEIVGEDEQGREGGSDISISGLAGEAAKAIRDLRQRERALIEANEAWEREHDDVKLARDAALEREQALAAHVERLDVGVDWLCRASSADEADYAMAEINDARAAQLTTSLARRDLLKQAEALWEMARDLLTVEMDEMSEVRQRLRDRAAELRRQASEPTP